MKARLFPLTFVCVLACALAAAARQAGGGPTHRLSLPGRDWALDVALPGFEAKEIEPGPGEKSAFLMAARPDVNRAVIFMIQLSPARGPGGAREFREFAVSKMKKGSEVRTESLKTWEYKQIPVARYRQTLFPNPSYNIHDGMSTTEAYFVKDDLWAAVRMVCLPTAEEEKLFHSVIDSVRFADRNAAPASSFDYFHRGRPLFKAADYPQAVENYRAALALERQQRRLAPDAWRALVEQLANAHAALSDYASAQEVLEYGLANDPAHFWFSYNLARVYAAAGDADNAVACLEKAAAVHKKADRRRLSGGGPPPDPSQDAVFARLKETDKFKKAAKALR